MFTLRNFHIKILLLFLILIFTVLSCTGEAVLSQVVNTRATIIFKGTYESNTPHPWSEIYQNNYVSSLPSPINSAIPLNDFQILF